MTAIDLRELLKAVASEAPEVSSRDADELLTRINRRRRKQFGIAGAVTVTAIGAMTSGVISGLLPVNQLLSESDSSSASGVIIGACGSRVTGTVESDRPLRMTADLPDEPVIKIDQIMSIDVRVTNASGASLSVRTATGADVTVVKDGVVVGTPAGIRDAGVLANLEPGASHVFKSGVSLQDCASSATPSARLSPGSYQLYGVQRFVLLGSDGESRSTIEVQGGPWRIDIR